MEPYLDVAPLHDEHTASGRNELLEDLREVLRHLKHTMKISFNVTGTKCLINNAPAEVVMVGIEQK